MSAETRIPRSEVECAIRKEAIPSGMSLNDLMANIGSAADASIREKYGSADSYPGYCCDIYVDYLIYRMWATETEPARHLKATWSIVDGVFTIGQWQEVVEVTTYVAIRKDRWQAPSIFDSLLV